MSTIDEIIERSTQVVNGSFLPIRSHKYKSYAITNFRGGIGKSTLSFNLAHELSMKNTLLTIDTCSQRNFSQSMFGDNLYDFSKTIYHSIIAKILNTNPPSINDIKKSIKTYSKFFDENKPIFMIPGSTELFLFPALLYSRLAQNEQIQVAEARIEANANILLTIKSIINEVIETENIEKVLIDTSPFFGGATHLSWCAADALIVPIRVDRASVDSFKLTLEMLDNKDRDFNRFNSQSNLNLQPKIHAVAMTHCGWSRQTKNKNKPDNTTKFFIEEAYNIAQKYLNLFTENDISKCFYILDDFHSSGRISGQQRMPLSKLNAGQKFMVDGKRLEVNPSITRYQNQIKNLCDAL